MRLDYREAARRITADAEDLGLQGRDEDRYVNPQPDNRPTVFQPGVQTDGLDPATVGGPAPYNSAQGPYGAPVASDPLLQAPIQPGGAVPHKLGPDEDTTILT